MTLTQVWGALVIFVVCPLLGGLPLIGWITRALTGRRLSKVGTGNISVSAAFYHGGRLAGILAVLSEAFKGIAAVLIARYFFPQHPEWELISLIALVMGRYWMGKGAGTTNVVWGFIVHDWIAAGLVFVVGGIGFTVLRERRQGRLGVLILFPLMITLLHPGDQERLFAAIALAFLLGWIYQKIPDDLDMPANAAQSESQGVFRFFRGDRALISLEQLLEAAKVGQKAATLSQLKRWGYPVPAGWVLPPGDDPEPLVQFLCPSESAPLVVRSSAIGEDSDQASAAGQYESILNVTDREELQQAIAYCLTSYNQPTAVQYRQDRGLPDASMAVIVQHQVQGVFSGVAFSRDPISRQGEAVVIEALPGEAQRVVSGQTTPELYRVMVPEVSTEADWALPADLELEMEGAGDLPPRLIQQVAFLARHLEARYHGIPQDLEWTYDGQTLWLLQSRPVTTLLPIWTRKIASEVIPGLIRPLTWSINRPLTCGVWGTLFRLVLGDRADGLDFNETATLHYSRAYFNASLLGQTFRRMGLPAESLEFLTRGAKFSKPPLQSTLRNVPGLLKLVGRERSLEQDFREDYQHRFAATLAELAQHPAPTLNPSEILQRIDRILQTLERATYYSILAPLSAALRQSILKVKDTELDNSQTPEVAALRSLQEIVQATRPAISNLDTLTPQSSTLFATLAELPNGSMVFQKLEQFLNTYGYLSEVGTDIAVPTWKEDPQPVRELFSNFLFYPTDEAANRPQPEAIRSQQSWKARQVQHRVDLKGQVTAIYSQLLAELRWSFVALEQLWLKDQLLSEPGDIFFLEFQEIEAIVTGRDAALRGQVHQLIAERRSQLEQDRQLTIVPNLVYGNAPPTPMLTNQWQASQQLQGIGASPGRVEGRIKVIRSLQAATEITREMILVVPYTDSGWAPLLARASGLIAEVGGRLSHGAIVAREYGIPAVMDIQDATHRLQEGQWVRIDGQQGTVEIL